MATPSSKVLSSPIESGKNGTSPKKRTIFKRSKDGRLRIPFIGAFVPIGILIIWQFAGNMEWISRHLLPPPLEISQSFWELIRTGELFRHLQVSVTRTLTGFVLGGGFGLLFGIAVGLFRRVEDTLDPSFQMLRLIPHLAVTPLFILWFGFGELSKVLLIAKGAFFPLYINTFLGIRGVDNKLFEVARVLQFDRYKQIIRLVIPAALPSILLGVRLSLGVAWLGLVVAELMGSNEGIGYLILDARQFSHTSVVFVGILIFAIVGKITDSLVRLLERRLLRWRDNYQG